MTIKKITKSRALTLITASATVAGVAAGLALMGTTGTGCELIEDFDRGLIDGGIPDVVVGDVTLIGDSTSDTSVPDTGSPDASHPDAATDAGTKADAEAGPLPEAGVDSGIDAGVDAGIDAGIDSGIDASTAANLTITPNTAQTYATTSVGSSSAQIVFTVKNTGTTTTTGNVTINVGGANAGDFAITNGGDTCSGAPLAGGATCTVGVYFAPTAAGTRAGTVDASATGTTSQSVALSGTGATVFTVTPASFDFGTVATGSASTGISFTVTNTGSVTSNVPVVVQPADADYQLNATDCNTALAPAGTCTFVLVFRPTAVPGTASSVVVNGGTSAVSASLTGIGAAGDTTQTLTIAPLVETFPTTALGSTSAAVNLVVTNSSATASAVFGASPITINGNDAANFNLAATAPPNPCVGNTIAPGGTCNIAVDYAPTTTGTNQYGAFSVQASLGGTPVTLSASLLGSTM